MCHPTNGIDRQAYKFPHDLRKVIGMLFPPAVCPRQGNQPSAAAGPRLASSRQSCSFSDALIRRGSSMVNAARSAEPRCARPWQFGAGTQIRLDSGTTARSRADAPALCFTNDRHRNSARAVRISISEFAAVKVAGYLIQCRDGPTDRAPSAAEARTLRAG
jgi:hypothetical protein